MKTFEELKEHLISESNRDEVGLWYIVVLVRRELAVKDSLAVRRLTLDLVRAILDSGKVLAGWYSDSGTGYKEWPLPTGDVIRRIEAEWEALGREPDKPEIVVFYGK